MRRPILVFLAVLVVLFVAVDRMAAAVADHVIATKIEHAASLGSRPEVSVRGFPLLTQVAAQDYGTIDVTAHDVRRGRLIASLVDLHLHDVHVPTGELLARSVSRIPVDRADGTVRFRYADLDRMLRGQDVSVAYAGGGRAKVATVVSVAGRAVPVSGVATVGLDGDQLVVTAQSVDVGGGSVIDAAVSALARGRLSFRLLLAGLPFGVHVDRVSLGKDGIVAHAVSHGFVIDVGNHSAG